MSGYYELLLAYVVTVHDFICISFLSKKLAFPLRFFQYYSSNLSKPWILTCEVLIF